MGLLLVRHGEAIPSRVGPDEERFLTAQGRIEARALGRSLRGALERRGVALAAVVSSPLVRAVQTAELVAAAAGFEGVVTVDPAFTPDADPHAALARVPSAQGGLVAVVCHEPIVRRMAALATATPTFPHFSTGGAAWIERGALVCPLP